MFEKLFNSAPDEMQEKYQNKWEKENLLQKSIDIRDGKEPFIFYEGPPTANGKPGIHHVIARTLKDSVCRYKTMKGFKVERKAGWDTHGLPVEIEVEKQLNLTSKQEIEDYGIENFNEKCRESVFKYEKIWQDEYVEDANTLNVHVHSLRRMLMKYSTERTPNIKTVWGLGYKMEKQV